MKTLKSILAWWPLAAFCIALWLLPSLFTRESPMNRLRRSFTSVEPGQVWVYTIDDGNPFSAPMHNTNTVIEVRHGFVKYVGIGDMWLCQGTNSEETFLFKHGSKRIK